MLYGTTGDMWYIYVVCSLRFLQVKYLRRWKLAPSGLYNYLSKGVNTFKHDHVRGILSQYGNRDWWPTSVTSMCYDTGQQVAVTFPPTVNMHLTTADDIGALTQQVHDLSLAFVAPLRSQYHRNFILLSSTATIIPRATAIHQHFFRHFQPSTSTCAQCRLRRSKCVGTITFMII